MKVSELIERLEVLKAEHGDLEVLYEDCKEGLTHPQWINYVGNNVKYITYQRTLHLLPAIVIA